MIFEKTENGQKSKLCKAFALCMLSFVLLAALITLTPSAYAESVNGEASTEVYLQASGSSSTDDGDDSDDGDTTTTITKDSTDSSSPKAGDETTALVFFLVISALSATALVVAKKRTNTKHIGGGNL